MKQVYLISCAKSKQKIKPSCRAEEMYVSPLYRASLSYAQSRAENKDEQIFILSALYGLVSLNENIALYEKTLGKMSRAEVAEWEQVVSKKLLFLFDVENTNFVFLAGEKYVSPLRKYLKYFSEPLQGMASIGGRVRWLNDHRLNNDMAVDALTAASLQSATKNKETYKDFYVKPQEKAKTLVHVTATQKVFADELQKQMMKASNKGLSSLTITSGELHRLVGGYPGRNHKMPTCCDVMYKAMRERDSIIEMPPKRNGASLKISFRLDHRNNTDSVCPVNMLASEDPRQNLPALFVQARELRLAENLQKISGDNPGWYRWWAPESVLKQLLNSPHISCLYMDVLSPHLWQCKSNDDNECYYGIYVGVAIKESIRDRLNWHVNQRHRESAVRSGFLSTLRKTVSSLVAGDQYAESATNELIDQLVIEYYAMNYPLNSEIAKKEIAKIERDQMDQYIFPLNIKGNSRSAILRPFLSDLKKARKLSNPHKQ